MNRVTVLLLAAGLVLALIPSFLAAFNNDQPAPKLGHARIADSVPPVNVWSATPPPPTTTTTKAVVHAASASKAVVYPSDELLHALAMCETGGTMNQRIVSDTNPPYFSFFQWEMGTWLSIGGQGDPRDAPYEVQAPLARALILRSGWSQFPRCSYVIGAR